MLEVESFHNRLINQMRNRIETIERDNTLPNIKIDIPALFLEQEERNRSFDIALRSIPHVKNWSKVIASNQLILK